MRVDEAGQQRGIPQVDRLGAGRKCRLGAGRGDLPVDHHHQPRRHHVIALAVEHVGCFEDVRLIGGRYRKAGRHQREKASVHLSILARTAAEADFEPRRLTRPYGAETASGTGADFP